MDGASCCRTEETGEWKEEKTGKKKQVATDCKQA